MQEILTLSPLSHTWLLDLDGTILKHNGHIIDGYDSFLPGAFEFLQTIPEGDMIIFLTSRERKFAEMTEAFLARYFIHYTQIIYDVPYGERILINDKKISGMLTAIALNVERNTGINIIANIDASK